MDTGRLETKVSFTPDQGLSPAAYRDAVEVGDLTYQIIVAEGATSWQIANALSAANFLSGSSGPQPAEGTLATGSYEVSPGSSRAELIERMQAKQSEILAAAWAAKADDLPLKSPEEVLILASIIEKETAVVTGLWFANSTRCQNR